MKDAIQEGRRGMPTESKTRHRLLAVDDDETIRTMLKDFFEGAGYAVDTAQDAGEALQRLSQDYHVILSDVMMPKVSGIDLLQQVRTKKPKALVFLITASPSLETLSAAKRYGAMAYFKKPLKLMEMEARIRGFLEASPGTPGGRPRPGGGAGATQPLRGPPGSIPGLRLRVGGARIPRRRRRTAP